MPPRDPGEVDRRARTLATGCLIAALVAPVVLDRDGFPLSTYPMYSRARSTTVSLVTARLVDDDGSATPLSLSVIGDSDDPLIVAGELRAAIDSGRAGQRCAEIAGRAADRSALPEGASSVEVVTERHDVVAQVLGRPSLIDRRVDATCPVEP